MEDAATAEISRSQLWQWVQRGATTAEGPTVTAALVEDELRRVAEQLTAAGADATHVQLAVDVFRETALGSQLVEFLTVPAQEHLG